MEILLFTTVAVVLYAVSDAIVRFIEKRRGELLPNRSVIFFAIIMVLSLLTFNAIQYFGPQLGLGVTTVEQSTGGGANQTPRAPTTN